MSIIQAYKSDADGKVFEFKVDYTKHLRKLAAKRREEKKRIQHIANRELFLDKMGQVGSFIELEQFIKDNWVFFRMNAQERAWGKRLAPKSDNLIGLTLKIDGFDQFTSNSHKCPRKGVTNWGNRTEGAPTSYPGWRGRINFSVTHSTSFSSNYFEQTPICTGGGGGGDGSLSYDLTLWAADFPVIWEKHCRDEWIKKENSQRDFIWHQLGGVGSAVHVTECPADWVCPDPMGDVKTVKEYA